MLDTMGFAMLLEALNEPCGCERLSAKHCAQYRDSKDPFRRLRRMCAGCNHFEECHGPIDRWWLIKRVAA